jgi:hypothetical protein
MRGTTLIHIYDMHLETFNAGDGIFLFFLGGDNTNSLISSFTAR